MRTRGHGSARSIDSPRISITLDPVASSGGLRDQHLGDVHHVVPVAERLVELHHRELRVVAGRHALVAEDPADLEHPLHAADDQALEVELERDAQIQIDVERVVVGDERAGVRAARLDVQHRGLDLDEPAIVQGPAEAGDHRVADLERPPRLLVDDQVGVPLTETGVGVGQAVPLVGHGPQRLGQQFDLFGLDRQLALARGHHRARDTDPVAEVELLDRVERVVADDRLGDEQLDVTGAIAQRGEDQLAGVAEQHQPPGDLDLVGGLGAGFEMPPAVPDPRRSCVRSNRYGYGFAPDSRIAVSRSRRRARSAVSPLPLWRLSFWSLSFGLSFVAVTAGAR